MAVGVSLETSAPFSGELRNNMETATPADMGDLVKENSTALPTIALSQSVRAGILKFGSACCN
jgi:hypothetical protein